jgi:hypothetical protein
MQILGKSMNYVGHNTRAKIENNYVLVESADIVNENNLDIYSPSGVLVMRTIFYRAYLVKMVNRIDALCMLIIGAHLT